MPITGLTSASEPKHTQKGKRGARTPITGLTSASEPKHTHTGTRMPLDGLTSASKHTTTKQVNRESGTRAYNRQAHTQKERKVPGETSHGLLPTYLIWYEDQGDVVPLNGKEILARNQGESHY